MLLPIYPEPVQIQTPILELTTQIISNHVPIANRDVHPRPRTV